MTAAADVARDAQRADLLAVLDGHDDDGRIVPCRASDARATTAWTSDDPEDQATADRACRPCPARWACAQYGLAWPKEAGVYGAMTEPERHQAAQEMEEPA